MFTALLPRWMQTFLRYGASMAAPKGSLRGRKFRVCTLEGPSGKQVVVEEVFVREDAGHPTLTPSVIN